ncbi:MAG: hypothetical protein K2W82_03030 [Candidatus Obscuribacterales bacterium]|nr:hypothetical protein [Candidatus Obscuribacterales bacterium]
MPSNAVLEQESGLDRSMLNEIVHWVKTLNEVGVSPDVAAQVATKFFVAACNASEEEELCDDEEYCDEDN